MREIRDMPDTIQNEALRVRISRRGGEMQSITGANGVEYLWNGDPEYWKGRAPNLFPYIGRLTEGTYTYNGDSYRMPIHGFLPTSELECVQKSETVVEYALEESAKTYAVYPFRFELQIRYLLENNTLHIRYAVKNRDKKTLYFGIGGHPGFRVPLEEGMTFSDYRLAFRGDAEKVLMSDTCFCTGRSEPMVLDERNELALRHDLFDHDAIVTRYPGGSVRLYAPKGRHSVTVAAPQMPYWGFWHRPRTDAPYLCIEPWSSLPSRNGIVEDLARQENLIKLEPGGKYHNDWSIMFE